MLFVNLIKKKKSNELIEFLNCFYRFADSCECISHAINGLLIEYEYIVSVKTRREQETKKKIEKCSK